MSILDFLNATKPPQPRSAGLGTAGDLLDPQAPATQPSGWQRIVAGLSDAGQALQGGQGTAVSALKEKYQNDADAAAKRTQMLALAKSQFPDDPRMQLAFAANPTPFLNSMAENLKDYTLSEGQVRGHNGQVVQYNPKTGIDGGRGYSLASNGTATWDATARPADYTEQAGLQNAATNAGTLQERIANDAVEHTDRVMSDSTSRRNADVSARSSAASTAVAAGHLGLDRQKFGYEQTQDVAKLHPDAIPLTSKADYARLPSGAKYIAPGERFARIKP